MIRCVRLALALAVVVLTGCGGVLRSQQPPAQWSIGFWLWQGNAPPVKAPDGITLDTLYFQAGIVGDAAVFANVPPRLPPARESWIVFRFEANRFRDLGAGAILALRKDELLGKIAGLRALAAQRGLNLKGVQLDVDYPTRELSKYADFLRDFRKGLPAGFGLSITALPDWFREGTDAGKVIDQVDEFVPQFYDLNPLGTKRFEIAARFDGARWGPVFNRYGKPFRIGISSFGRAVQDRAFYTDLTPLDVTMNQAFHAQSSRNEPGETVLTYTATRKTEIRNRMLAPEATLQFILPEAAVVREAVESARRIGGNCAGVVIFRWPLSDEALVMDPSEALAAAGAISHPIKPVPEIKTVDGGCATASCSDVYLLGSVLLNATAARYRIHSSAALDYFLPEEGVPVRMAGQMDLEVSLPPYGGRPNLLLGRAVSKIAAKFTVEREP